MKRYYSDPEFRKHANVAANKYRLDHYEKVCQQKRENYYKNREQRIAYQIAYNKRKKELERSKTT